MKDFKERFSPETQRDLQGICIPTLDVDRYDYMVPLVEPLTIDNFGIYLANGIILTADDFQWYEEDGSDRDFKYGDDDNYIYSSEVPTEVASLLNTVICTKFATRQLNKAKSMLEDSPKEHAKKELDKSISAFENASDSKEKLEIATAALRAVALVLDFCEDDFIDAFRVIDDVLSEI